MPNIALVGELNPYGADPRFALYHEPRNASGDRLRRILGLSVRSYVPIPKYNLCVGEWSMKTARAQAGKIWGVHDLIVVLGAQVRAAFEPLANAARVPHGGIPAFGILAAVDHAVIALPHPSGLCRAWNDKENVVFARALLSEHASLPCGEVEEFFRAPVRT